MHILAHHFSLGGSLIYKGSTEKLISTRKYISKQKTQEPFKYYSGPAIYVVLVDKML